MHASNKTRMKYGDNAKFQRLITVDDFYMSNHHAEAWTWVQRSGAHDYRWLATMSLKLLGS